MAELAAEAVSIHLETICQRLTRAVQDLVELLERTEGTAEAPELARARDELDVVNRVRLALREEFDRAHPDGWPSPDLGTGSPDAADGG